MALIAFLPKIKVELKERRGVAGLISVIAIVLVFGIAATASLQLNSQQASLISNTSRTIDVQGKKATENLELTITGCTASSAGKRTITVQVKNKWSESSVLDSVIFTNGGSVTDSVYIPINDKKITSVETKSITLQVKDTVTHSHTPRFVTELGKTHLGSFGTTTCP